MSNLRPDELAKLIESEPDNQPSFFKCDIEGCFNYEEWDCWVGDGPHMNRRMKLCNGHKKVLEELRKRKPLPNNKCCYCNKTLNGCDCEEKGILIPCKEY